MNSSIPLNWWALTIHAAKAPYRKLIHSSISTPPYFRLSRERNLADDSWRATLGETVKRATGKVYALFGFLQCIASWWDEEWYKFICWWTRGSLYSVHMILPRLLISWTWIILSYYRSHFVDCPTVAILQHEFITNSSCNLREVLRTRQTNCAQCGQLMLNGGKENILCYFTIASWKKHIPDIAELSKLENVTSGRISSFSIRGNVPVIGICPHFQGHFK